MTNNSTESGRLLNSEYESWRRHEECFAMLNGKHGIIERVFMGRGINKGMIRIKFHKESGGVVYCHSGDITVR